VKIAASKGFLYLKDISEPNANSLGATWMKGIKAWRLPCNTYSLREVFKMFPTTEVMELGLEHSNKERRHLRSKQLEDAEGHERLRAYQRVDVQFLRSLSHAGIFNQQRTGKTPTALFTTKEYDLNIIVCPASLLLQWEKEVYNWVGKESSVFVYKGSKHQRKRLLMKLKDQLESGKNQYLIVSYETLRNDIEDVIELFANIPPHACLIVDEAHRLANHRTKTYKAMEQLRKHVHKSLALTGTPAMNHAADIYGILRFLHPDRFTSYWQFVERYFHINDGFFGKEIGGYKRKEELQHVLDLFSVQRKRKDVMEWLPEKEYITYELEADKKQLEAYESMLNTFEFEHVDAPSVLAQLTRLRQITLAPELLEIDAKSAKEQWLVEFISDNPNDHIIIFSSFTSYLKILKNKLKNKAVMIHGEMSPDEKQAATDQFQNNEGTNILLANIKAGGTGWTLNRATITIFLDRAYNPTLNEQAEDRMVATEEGNTESKTVIDLVVKDTVDEHIISLVKAKENIIKHVNDYGISKLLGI